MIPYELLPSQRLVRVELSGHLDYPEAVQLVQNLLADPGFDPGYNALIEVGQLTGSLERVRDLTVQFLEGYAKKCGAARWAFLVQDALTKSLIETTFQGVDMSEVQLRYFEDEAVALAWLGKQ